MFSGGCPHAAGEGLHTGELKGVLINGLRRSGTTVLWETFRLDPRLVCFDEPFHPELWRGARDSGKGTWEELAVVWRERGSPPVPGAQPIRPVEELSPGLTPEQRRYFDVVFAQEGPVVVDSVRIWSKLEALSSRLNSVLVLHLVRHPTTWATAHLLPTSSNASWRRRASNVYRRLSFFRRRGFFNNWHYQEIIHHSLRTDEEFWRTIGRRPRDVAKQPAFKKLLSFWWAATLRTEAQLRTVVPHQYVTVSMEEFLANPEQTLLDVYLRCDWSLPRGAVLDHIRPSRPAWRERSKYWIEGMQWAGIPEKLWDPASFSGAEVKRAAREYQP